MAALITLSQVSKGFSDQQLFHDISYSIDKRDRIGIVGPNGSGKSTFLKILAGQLDADQGTINRSPGLRMAYVAQEDTFNPDHTALEVVEAAMTAVGLDPRSEGYRASMVLSQLGFTDNSVRVTKLSGGWRKRLSIAAGLVQDPDILLLDEPTNHLDLEGIHFLEQLIDSTSCAWVMITHDRFLLHNTADKIVEVNRVFANGLMCTDGSYREHLEARESFLSSEAQRAQAIASVMRKEQEWLRRQPKARGTKAKARIDQAYQMMSELGEIRSRLKTDKTSIDFTDTGRKTKRLLECKNVNFTYGETTLIQNLNLVLTPGESLGLLGSNGSGKSTLLRLMTGDLKPSGGTIERTNAVQIVFFDQYRTQLNDSDTLKEALAPMGDTVVFQGESIHVHGWAKRFR
ncbi:MAG: ABC-F family ATP-binding cassette domain-containing protein, partial [Bdellovibrionales bacterium]|nr:ABC-F family ATP-binding cassette domain-containing protein [Bdellovibrionales bacterium]